MTKPTDDGYDRYQPQQEQPTQQMPPMPQQPTQQFEQVPYQEPAQQHGDVTGASNIAPPLGPNGQKHGQQGKKPWYKRPWVWIVVAVVIIIGLASGQGGSKSPNTSAPASSTHSQATTSKPAKETFDLQTLVGKKWDEARQTLTDHHWTSTDFTMQTDDGKTPIIGRNWTVTGVSTDAKPVISLRHDTKTQPAQPVAPAPTQEPAQEQAPAQAPAPAPTPDTDEYYQNCDAVRAAGKAPLYQNQPGYRPALDRDHDGVACE